MGKNLQVKLRYQSRFKGPEPKDLDNFKNAESEHLIGCSAQILPIKSDIKIVTICQLRALNLYCSIIYN